jgi:hypothetical protein
VYVSKATHCCKIPSLLFCYLNSLSRGCLDREQSSGLDFLRLREHSGSTHGGEKRSGLHLDNILGQLIEKRADLADTQGHAYSGFPD